MYCPRCGAENKEGDRFCAACGRALPGTPDAARERRSLRDSARRAVGTTPRARMITAGTVAAIAIAIVAFIALDPAEDEEQADAYSLAADQVCAKAKKEIVASAERAFSRDPIGFASRLIPLVSSWRSDLNALVPPADRADEARALDEALRDVEIGAGTVARRAEEGSQEAFIRASGRLDERTREVERAISELDLRRCSRIAIAPFAQQSGG